MQEKFVEVIERQTGRRVAAFLSADRQDPDLAAELFVLEPERTGYRAFADTWEVGVR